MSPHNTARRFPRRRQLPKLTLGDQQTRRLMLDAGKDPRTTFWCRTRKNQRCSIGGCGDCTSKLDGRISHTITASVLDKQDNSWSDVEWNLSQTTLDLIVEQIPEGAGMVELDLTRFGTGFDTTYKIEIVSIDEVEDVADDSEPEDIDRTVGPTADDRS